MANGLNQKNKIELKCKSPVGLILIKWKEKNFITLILKGNHSLIPTGLSGFTDFPLSRGIFNRGIVDY